MPREPLLRDHRLWLKLAVVAWAVVLIVVCVRAALSGGRNSVYEIFAEAGRSWLGGRALYDYDPAHLSGPFRYSPLVAVLLVPYGLLPNVIGGTLWRLSCTAILLGGLAWWSRSVLPLGSRPAWRAGLFLLVLPLAVSNLNNGQTNTLLLGFLLLSAAALVDHEASKQRWLMELVIVATMTLAVLLKGYPVAAVLLLLVAAPRRRFLFWLVLALAVGFALPFVAQRPDYVAEQWVRWGHHVLSDARSDGPRELWYRDLHLLLANLGFPLGRTTYALVQFLVGGVMAALIQWLRWAGCPVRRRIVFALGLAACWMTVFGSTAEAATYLLVAPTVAWALLEGVQRRWSWPIFGLLLSAYLLLLTAHVAAWFPQGKDLHALGVHPVAGLLLLAGLIAAEVAEVVRARVPRPDRMLCSESQDPHLLLPQRQQLGQGGTA